MTADMSVTPAGPNSIGEAVTIGMPVYNGAAYLPQAIASLSAQSASASTILVSDNASTDATPDLLADWAARDARVRVHRQHKNIGASGNFEWLAQNAQTAHFMFAAHDDGWSPNYVEALSRALASAEDIGLAVGATTLMTESWQPIRQVRLPQPAGNRSPRAIARQIRQVRAGWFYGMYRRELLLAALPRLKSYGHVWGNDFMVLLPILLSHRVAIEPEATFYQRTTQTSAALYRPPSAAARWRMHRAAERVCFDALRTAPLSPAHKALLAPAVFAYASRHSCKIRDIIWQAVSGIGLRSGKQRAP